MKHIGMVVLFLVGFQVAGWCILDAEGKSPPPRSEANRDQTAPIPAVGSTFRDCASCPEVVVVPAGSFVMGSTAHNREEPPHPVAIAKPFAIGRYEVTFEEWDACLADGGCSAYFPSDGGWGRGRRPVINVSWDDAQAFVAWMKRRTGKPYRLASESEWEYAARAGTTTRYWWGDGSSHGKANCDGCGSQWDDKSTAPVGSFGPNGFGLFDTSGNVTEWVEDRWNATFVGAPADGSAWTVGDHRRRVMRSGSWFNNINYQRSSYRNGDAPTVRNIKIGFRIARSLE